MFPAKLTRRGFLRVSAVQTASAFVAAQGAGQSPPAPGSLTLNDDGYVFLHMNDDLDRDDLRRYLQSYCRPGVDTVAYCVGDMSWPTLHPTRVGVHYDVLREGADASRTRMLGNLDNFESERGGYFGAVFEILREYDKRVLASFRMNDAHFTSTDNPNVSEFWKQHTRLALGPDYGYYGGCLNYEHEAVRAHFFDRVMESVELYPEVDGVELDAMRSPYFFPPGRGAECASLFTDLVRKIREALASQANRLSRKNYVLAVNAPLTPALAMECGLDCAAWDAEGLLDRVSVGAYQASMDAPIEQWKEKLAHGTPVFAYINCSAQTGQYLGLEEYRAAAANAHARGADGIYLFNYPCLFELAMQVPGPVDDVSMSLPDMRGHRQPDLSQVGRALDEIGRADALRGKNKRYLFYFNNDSRYRHYAPTLDGLDRNTEDGVLSAQFYCYEEYGQASKITLRFKIENVARSERFGVRLNGERLEPTVFFAASGRDSRTHTVTLGPYLQLECALYPELLSKGENVLEITPTRLHPRLSTTITLAEIELIVHYNGD